MRKLLSSVIAAVAATVVAGAVAPLGAGSASAVSQETRDDFDAAVRVVGAYWDENFADMYDAEYRAPTVHGIISSQTPTHCGSMAEDNAVYCSVDHSLQFTDEFLTRSETIGDVATYQVVAHEWGHAIEHLVYPGRPVTSDDDVRVGEQFADCLAGGVLGDLERAGVLIVEDGDMDEIEAYLNDIGGSETGTHGSGEQRNAAFAKGWEGGAAVCTIDA